jgi:hypothetical protein
MNCSGRTVSAGQPARLERSRALRDNLAQLEQQNRMLQSLEQMKSTFLALASHELRTPLTVICSGAELLQTTARNLDDSGHCALEAILHGSRRLRDLVDDLLDAARREANSVYLAREDLIVPCSAVAGYSAAQRRLACAPANSPTGHVGDMHHCSRRAPAGKCRHCPRKVGPHRCQRREDRKSGHDRLGPSRPLLQRAHAASEISIRDNGIGLAR